jgi:hypothetical protein
MPFFASAVNEQQAIVNKRHEERGTKEDVGPRDAQGGEKSSENTEICYLVTTSHPGEQQDILFIQKLNYEKDLCIYSCDLLYCL